MPLAGFICCRDGSREPFGSCLERCRNRECVYPLPLLASIVRSGDHRKGIKHDLSATELTGCLRQVVLKEKHTFWEHPQDHVARWRGTNHHAAFDREGPFPGIVQERRLFADYDDEDGDPFTLSGQPDWEDETLGVIEDQKTCSKIPDEPYFSHVAQVNIYADLRDANGLSVPASGAVRYFDGKRFHLHRVGIWDQPERVEYIVGRATPIIRGRSGGPLPARLPKYPRDYACPSCPVRKECGEAP